jgi:PAS domain S-box-containing protein
MKEEKKKKSVDQFEEVSRTPNESSNTPDKLSKNKFIHNKKQTLKYQDTIATTNNASFLHLSTLFEEAADTILIGDPVGVIILANKPAFHLTGYTKQELIGSRIEILFTKEERERVPMQYSKLKTGEVVRSERILRHKNGTLVPVEMNTRMMPDLSYQTIIRDMTERKKIEDALRASEQKFSSSFRTSPDSININRASDGIYIEINEGFTKITGYTAEDVIGKSSKQKELGLWESDEVREKMVERLKATGEVIGYEAAFRMKDGSIRHGLISARFIEINGETCILSTTRDITERKKEEELLKESEQSIRGILNSISEAIYIVSASGRFIDVNHGAIKMYGYSHDEIVGQPIEFVSAPGFNDLDKVNHAVTITLITGETQKFEFWGKRKNGDFFPKEVICNKGNYFGQDVVIATARDISDTKKNEEALIAAKDKAEESEKLKSAFLANMSHEIRSPMNAIVGFSELLDDDDLPPEQRNDFITIIKNSGKHLLTIINDIIDFAKIDSNQLTISPSSIRLNQLLDDIFLSTEIEKQKLGKTQVELLLEKSFPDSNCTIYCDEIRLKQVLLNLIGNALKFTNTGFIKTSYKFDNETIVFSVQDTGKGIAKDKQGVIFERFRQEEESTTRKYGGTGLGLSISKGLVELLGGKIWLDSEPGKGSIFYFSLPISIWSGRNAINEEVARKPNEFEFKGKTIIIAEDLHSNFRLINYMLSKTHATILYAENGEQAVEFCRNEQKIDLILMDIQMPVMDGYEATTEIRKFLPDLPIIVLTAYSFEDENSSFSEKGCTDYLTKPIDKATMLAMVKKYIKS